MTSTTPDQPQPAEDGVEAPEAAAVDGTATEPTTEPASDLDEEPEGQEELVDQVPEDPGHDTVRLGVRCYSPGRYRVRVEFGDVGDPFFMAGTEGTGNYVVVLTTAASREELAELLTRHTGWKQPGDGGQDRFSITTDEDGLAGVLATVQDVLDVLVNPQLLQAITVSAKHKAFPEPEDPRVTAITRAATGLALAVVAAVDAR